MRLKQLQVNQALNPTSGVAYFKKKLGLHQTGKLLLLSIAMTPVYTLVVPEYALAKVRMPALFCDHMVLQQDAKLPVWGWADPQERVTVTIGTTTATTTADEQGKWQVVLPDLPDDAPPETLTVRGKNVLTIHDVLVGDVWLASGQSNMAFPLRATDNAQAAIIGANDPELRFFIVSQMSAAVPQSDVSGHWVICSPQTAGGFSGVAYYFGRDLRRKLNRPIGIIGAYWGGTVVQAWTSILAFQQKPPLIKYVKQFDEALEAHQQAASNPNATFDYMAAEKQWLAEIGPGFNVAMKAYQQAEERGEDPGPVPIPSSPEPVNPDPMGVPNSTSRPHIPGVLFNAMIAPLVPYAIKGVIWYQGESNAMGAEDPLEYQTLFSRMITNWRESWDQGDFPFLFVQLPNWISDPKGDKWAYLREAQLKTLALRDTGMAVTIDIGNPNNIHPKDKVDVGRRLALLARDLAYGEKVVSSGPMYKASKVKGNTIKISFTHVGGGLAIGQSPWMPAGVEQYPQNKLIGFTIAGADNKWIEADAKIKGNIVVVSSKEVTHPVAVRYGWSNAPRCNLYNKENLPASPFRTDR